LPPISISAANASAYPVTIFLNRRQRDVHDGVVEHDHEEPKGDGGERPPLAPLL
jgi:hypothetical protein